MQPLLMKNYLQESMTINYLRIFYSDALGMQQYATNSLLFLRVIQDKYMALYRELITQLHTYMVQLSECWLKVIYLTL